MACQLADPASRARGGVEPKVGKQGLELRLPVPKTGALTFTPHPVSGDGRNRTGCGNACRARPLLSCRPPRAGFREAASACRYGAHAMDVSKTKPVREARRDGRSSTRIFPVLGTGCLSAGSSLSKMKTAPRDPLGRLPASASWLLHSNHSTDQGSRKLRDRVHVPGSFRLLPCRHVSMVGRRAGEGNCIYRRIMKPGGAWLHVRAGAAR